MHFIIVTTYLLKQAGLSRATLEFSSMFSYKFPLLKLSHSCLNGWCNQISITLNFDPLTFLTHTNFEFCLTPNKCGSSKNVSHSKMLTLQKCWPPKNVDPQKIITLNIFNPPKRIDLPKNVPQTNFDPHKILTQKMLTDLKCWQPKLFTDQKLWPTNIFDPRTNVDPQKMLTPLQN